MQLCLATLLATIIFTSVRSVLGHRKKDTVDRNILRSWPAKIALGALIGVGLAFNLSLDFLLALFGALALVVGAYLWLERASWPLVDAVPVVPTRAVSPSALGFMPVLRGIGGGSFGVPLTSLYNSPIHCSVTKAPEFGVLIAVPSVLGFLWLPIDLALRPPLTIGVVNLIAFGVMIGMTLITAPFRVRLAHATDPKPLKWTFALFLILVVLSMLHKGVGW